MDIISESKSTNLKIVSDTATTASATDTINTGLRKLNRVVVSFESDPGDANLQVSAVPVGESAPGSFVLKTWKTDGSDPTPVAATSFAKKVAWIAVGY